MKRTAPIRTGDITGSILSVITSEWQSAAIIACQVVLPPDAVSRRTQHRNAVEGCGKDMGSRTDLIHQRLRSLVAKGLVEKQPINGFRNEYRLAQPKH